MRISRSCIIEDEKIEHYLLSYRPRNDKSKWLGFGGIL